ncbi:helix-turn-helix transcriptional regulator [Listeria monocytogenes]|uniref:XRE family transcriptional regulator n=1 Tax=Listeria monocytogenes TaxID=1639 RepID=A0A6C8MZX8_LISMN|nr:helix-turn-helix transcriptional regulator [Listeria monocytogenes]KAA9534088.1 XRE family transcriptional regulator [Listeria monocytogenes]KAA9541487.1 XRE family transcriptional regulator [Listeria monocytogenes]HAB7745290.1 XRE family transcriptional regulator [Listeria monocytogenes]
MITAKEFKSPYYNLKVLIDKKNLTQAKIADEIGMDRSTFNLKINRSKGRDFTFEEAIKISVILNEKIDHFF